MFHSGTQTLIDHWAALPEAARIPAREALEPLRLGRLVPQLFSADRVEAGATFRLAGAWIESLHGQPMRGLSWLDLWAPESRPLVAGAVVQTFREARPVVMVAEADRLRGVLEIVIAPLRRADGTPDRLIGLYQPAVEQARRTEPVGPMTARLSVGVGGAGRASLTLAALDGRRIA
ncbi:MAG: PAS domain-containing protein [Alphaproteobacteria bacterium]|nr:PAS domain-containing protein [Alphaproteobacteria bacterium]